MKRRWRVRNVGCVAILLLGSLVVTACVVYFFRPMRREPELPVQQLLHEQLRVFPPGWILDTPEVSTDSDFTWGVWAVTAHFYYQNHLEYVSEEIHVFNDPTRAHILFRTTSRLSPSMGYQTFIPAEWTYRPSGAQQFEIRCVKGETKIKSCEVGMRYEEYVIRLYVPVGSLLSLEEMKDILEVIDREMTVFLEDSTLRSGFRLAPRKLDK